MKCGNCGAILSVGGTKQGVVGTQIEIEAHAHAMDDYVRCWRCGWESKPHHKPSDRPKLHRGGTDGGKGPPMTVMEYYAKQGQLREVYRKVRGRRVDEGL